MEMTKTESPPDRAIGAGKGLGVVGFSQDIGASRRGVDMGPFAIRAEGLEKGLERLGYDFKEFGNVHCISMEDAAYLGENFKGRDNLKYLEPIRQNMLRLKEKVERIVGEGRKPIVLGGDHSMAMGSQAGMAKKYGGNVGLLWVDAHGDYNTPETTETGNIHGMPLAVINGKGAPELVALGPFPSVPEKNTVLFGVRDLDYEESRNLRNSGVRLFTMRDILEKGFYPCLNEALACATEGVDNLYLSFDMDSIDPMFCPGTGTAVPGGLVDREALYLVERVHETGKLVGMDLVEVNPALDVNNKTARFAVELICRAFGKRSI